MTRVLRSRLRHVVIVTLKSGASFRGVLFDTDRQALVLRNTEVLGGRDGVQPVDGELVVLMDDVAYLQVV